MPQRQNRRQPKKVQEKKAKKHPSEAVFSDPHNYRSTTVAKYKKPKSNDGGIKLSKCAFKYALAIADPFNPMARDACVPVYPSPNSHKNTALTRITVTIGTQGLGFLILCPCLANNMPSIFYTTSAFTGTLIAPLSANNVLATGVLTETTPTPFTRANLTVTNGYSDSGGRIVSLGARMRYTGTTMNESGTYSCYVSPDHSNPLGVGFTPSALGGFLETTVSNVTRDPCSISVYGISSQETGYASNLGGSTTYLMYPYTGINAAFNGGFTYLSSSVNVGSPCAVIAVTGVAGSTFLAEVIQHSEFIGPSAMSLATPSDSDTQGFELVTAAAAQLPARKSQTTNHSFSPLRLLVDGIKEVATALKPVAIDALVKLGTSALL